MNKIVIKESVRNLVEFVLLKGDIDNRFSGASRAVDGIKAHQMLQQDNEKIYNEYEKEVYLSYQFEREKTVIQIEGRADGIIKDNGKIIIEEIKSTYKKFSYIDDSNELHWAQAKVYAFIYGMQNKIDQLCIRLSYVQLETNEVKSFEKSFSIKELELFILKILDAYEAFNIFLYIQKEQRDESIKRVSFPFEEYREGQRKLAASAYSTIKEGGMLFVQAPTGIGKTISTIFPAVKALGEGFAEKIIYLTSKTINREVAEEAFLKLKKGGLVFRNITLTAKEKSCCNSTFDCNPENCIYAKGYFDRIREVIIEVLKNEDNINIGVVKFYADKYKVCPFELSLDLSVYCDGIICDYNYIFDPRVSLTRVVEGSRNIVLVDEAHNLIERARNMYSASLCKSEILNCKKIAKGKMTKLHSVLNKINSYFIELRNECENKEVDWFYEKDKPDDLSKYLNLYLKESEEILVKGNNFKGYEEILQLYFDINAFNSVMQLYNKNYVTCIAKDSQDVILTSYCVNPSENLNEYLSKCYSVIFFSATLSPIKYYINMLGGNENSYRLKLPSPFKKENLKVYISPINIRYKHRKRTVNLVAEKINKFINEEKGNYIVFCPSYAYLEMLWNEMSDKSYFDDFQFIKQEVSMNEEEKSEFLKNFRTSENIIAFCVLGGMFSEGVDLPGNQLIGSVIIGVGYPQINMMNEISKEFFEDEGYDYAYVYPGVNKVQQGAGRVIRTETDKGRILLIDDRYITGKYSTLLPNEWYPINKY